MKKPISKRRQKILDQRQAISTFDRAIRKQIADTFGDDALVTHIEAHPTDPDSVVAYYYSVGDRP